MTKTNQTQSAGDNSTQIQAGTIQNYYTTITGIDEVRARSICKEEYAIAMQNWTSEAIAIEIVDQVDDSALVGLSVVYALSKFSPVSVVLKEGLTVLNRLYAKIISDMSLPEGITWMEHMDLVSAIRLGSRGLYTFKKCEEYFPERLSQYFMSGLPKDSDEYRDLEASFRSVSLGTNCLVPHPLRPGYFLGGVGKVSSPISHSKMV